LLRKIGPGTENESAILDRLVQPEGADPCSGPALIWGYWGYEGKFNLTAGITYTINVSINMTRIITPKPAAFPWTLKMVRIVELDYLRVERQTLDPFMPDADGDSVPDGEEAFSWGYPLNPDPDEDGLDDRTELNLGTNPGMKDSDLDGVRDRLELGYLDTNNIDSSPWITTPSKASWTERIQRDPHHNMMKPEDEPIDNWVDTGIWGGGGEPSFTDPLNPDSDYDGLPDGWRDGWTYNPAQTPPEGQRTTNLNNMRYGGLNYWRYNECAWGLYVDKLDNKVQIYEGEDLNGDGKAEHDGHPLYSNRVVVSDMERLQVVVHGMPGHDRGDGLLRLFNVHHSADPDEIAEYDHVGVKLISQLPFGQRC
jgi:hypothetical protein